VASPAALGKTDLLKNILLKAENAAKKRASGPDAEGGGWNRRETRHNAGFELSD
jgi:hypothetical protein